MTSCGTICAISRYSGGGGDSTTGHNQPVTTATAVTSRHHDTMTRPLLEHQQDLMISWLTLLVLFVLSIWYLEELLQ